MVGMTAIQKTTLIDFPEHIAATIFIQGCNFRCPYCHNKDLIKPENELLTKNYINNFVEKRRDFLQGIAFTGGEPTLYPDLGEIFKVVKRKGLAVKLDTNGSRPEVLKSLIDDNLVDYIAMDIKSDWKGYSEVIGLDFDLDKLKKSIQIIKNSNVNYEFRTTVIPTVITKDTVNNIINNIIKKDVKKYVLQRYQVVRGYIEKEHTKKEWYELEETFEKYEFMDFRDNF